MPKNTKIKSKKGFTIIEVVLVLAVAGLIFLMAFIALPAMQRSQRDTQRRQDYAMLSTAITSFSTANGGRISQLLPSGTGAGDYRILDPVRYVNKMGTDPNGFYYEVMAIKCGQTTRVGESCETPEPKDYASNPEEDATPDAVPEDYNGKEEVEEFGSQVYVVINADCEAMDDNGYSIPAYNKSSRAFAIYGYLESGTYCTASQ